MDLNNSMSGQEIGLKAELAGKLRNAFGTFIPAWSRISLEKLIVAQWVKSPRL
jgi:hypothetical protein